MKAKWTICLAAALLLPMGADAYVDPQRPMPRWQMLPAKSYIAWSVKYSGQMIHGTFPDFTADIVFDDTRARWSSAIIKVSTAKVQSDDKDAQDNLPTTDWLNPKDYPLAVFDTRRDGFTQVQGEQYMLTGEFTLHGFKTTLTLPITIHVTPPGTGKNVPYAVADGTAVIHRLDFKIGQGDWGRTDVLGNDVTIHYHIEATPTFSQ